MIIDTIENAYKYFCTHPHFERAFSYINSKDLETVNAGTYMVLEDKIRAIFSNNPAMTKAASIAEFECHNKHIDIQVCINGNEEFGWKPRQSCVNPKGEYDEEKDVQLYNDMPDMYFQLHNGQFVILFPEDVHAPMIGAGTIKKLVIKIKL